MNRSLLVRRIVLALCAVSLLIGINTGSVAAAPNNQVCNYPWYCVITLEGVPQISINQVLYLKGRGYQPREPIYFFMNCESLGQVALWDAVAADALGQLSVGLVIPQRATGACYAGALGMFSGVLGLRPVFVFGAGVVTLPTAVPTIIVPTAVATAVRPTATAVPPSATPSRPVSLLPGAEAGGVTVLVGGLGAVALIFAQRRPDRP